MLVLLSWQFAEWQEAVPASFLLLQQFIVRRTRGQGCRQCHYVSNRDLSELSKKKTHPVRLIIKRLLIIILCRCIQAHFFHKAAQLNSEVTCLMSHGPFPHVKISMGTRQYTSLVPILNFRARAPSCTSCRGAQNISSEPIMDTKTA